MSAKNKNKKNADNKTNASEPEIQEAPGSEVPTEEAKGEEKAESTAEEKAVVAKPAKKKRAVWKIILSNPIFWLLVSIGLLIGAIEYFERYTQIGINNTYKIF